MKQAGPELTMIGAAEYFRLDKAGNITLETRYYISSKALDAETFAKAVRRHRGIENQLHWVLDVAMREDNCQIYRGDAAQNLACFRQVALNQLGRETSKNVSIKRKQKKAGMNSAYLEMIINA
tara:strand:+ start:143517 stop:143885 length:369 start_codon:yes stop_codon:yes gene_type:complete